MTARLMFRTIVTAPIVLYQRTLSFDHGPMRAMHPFGFCPFYPSCSEYCRQSILKRGVVIGVARGAFRILRCHPWAKGGVETP